MSSWYLLYYSTSTANKPKCYGYGRQRCMRRWYKIPNRQYESEYAQYIGQCETNARIRILCWPIFAANRWRNSFKATFIWAVCMNALVRVRLNFAFSPRHVAMQTLWEFSIIFFHYILSHFLFFLNFLFNQHSAYLCDRSHSIPDESTQ